MTGEGAGPTPDKNGDMFQAPSRRDNVSPFEPEDSPADDANGDPGTGSNVSSPGRSLGILCAPTPQPPVGVEQTPRIRSTPFGDRRAEKRFGRRDLVLPRNLEPSDGVV